MKKQSSLIILFVPLFVVSALAQTGSKTPIDTLYERISQLEQSIRDQKESQRLAVAQIQQNTNQAISEQFKNASQALQTGLETGSAIELIIPETLRLIETKALTETLTSINNPTSSSVGQPFSDMVIESASAHLLPRFPTDELQQSAKVKFKSVLEAIYKGPLVQSVINSNPISSTINAAIQQAGFFEKSRQPVTLVTKKQIKDISETLPLKIEVNTANAEGTSFGTKEINEFNTDLEKRIEFYVAINQYGIDQGAITQQLYIEAKLIKKSAKASKTEICKLLEIDPNNASASFNTKFGSITIDQMKNYLTRDANFKKALSLSDYAQERLPEVKEFNTTVIDAVVEYIDGYIKLLNKYKDIQEAKLNATEISKQVSKLEGIKAGLKKPLK